MGQVIIRKPSLILTKLEIDPKNIDALIFKAQALYNIDNHTGAIYYFGKAFEMDPNNELAKKIFSSIIKKE